MVSKANKSFSAHTWRGPIGVAVAVFVFSWTLTTHGKYSVSGDEPHYLMISESLRTDRDLDLSNNYAQNDGRLFGQDNLPIELHALPSKSGELRSIHGLGIAVLVLPAYSVGQLIASSIPESRLQRFRMSRGLFSTQSSVVADGHDSDWDRTLTIGLTEVSVDDLRCSSVWRGYIASGCEPFLSRVSRVLRLVRQLLHCLVCLETASR